MRPPYAACRDVLPQSMDGGLPTQVLEIGPAPALRRADQLLELLPRQVPMTQLQPKDILWLWAWVW